MDLTRAAIEKNRIIAVALLIVMVGGMSAFTNMSRAEDPGFIIRTAQVLTIFPGASPERVENLVTDKLEKAIQEMPELDFVMSTSKTGVSIVMVNIREEFTEMRPIWDSLRRKVDKTAPELPENIIGPTVNDEFGDVFGVVITITGDGFSYAELKEVADEVRDELLRIDEVVKVDIYGAQEERIFVDYDNSRLAEIGLSPLQLRLILEGANIIIPGGDVSTGVERIVLEPTGNFETVEDLRQTVVTLPGRQDIVYLGDLASIYRGYIDPPSNTMHASGQAALGLAISMREGGNIVVLGDEVSREMARLQAIYPLGVDFDVVAFQPEVVDRKLDDFVTNLLQAVVIVLGVMLVFLGIRTGLVVSSLVPMAMILAILVKAKLRTLPGTKNISNDWGARSKKLVVRVDQPRARRAGVTNQDIAISLQTALSGFVTTQFREEDEIIPVSLRSAEANRADVTKMTSLNVYAQTTGRSVPLLQVADVEVVWQAAKVQRRNRLKTVTVSSELDPGRTPSDIVADLRPWLDAEQSGWGLGYLYQFGGEEETVGQGEPGDW
jgi:multidrug efflux pump subunit AcrB